MINMKHKTVIISILFILSPLPGLAEETKEPFLEAWQLFQHDQPQAGDLQRQIVMFNAQSRLSPDWAEPYRQLTDIYLQIGRLEQARKACQKFLAHQPQNAYGQLQLVNIELQQYQITEVRRQYLEQILQTRKDLLPEIISDIYFQLAQIAYQNFETDRAVKYLEFSIKRMPQNLKAQQLMRVIVDSDKQADGIKVLGTEIVEYQARVLTNGLDGYAAYKLGTLAGKAGMPELMESWLTYAEKIRKTYRPKEEWPEQVKLELAESYLASGRPKAAMEILEKVIPTSGKGNYIETRARILLLIALTGSAEEKKVRAQREWLENLAEAIKKTTGDSSQLILVSLFYSVYGELAGKINPAVALGLAHSAVKAEPENRKAKLAMALALARSGETQQSSQLLNQLDKPGDSLVMYGQILNDMNRKKEQEARDRLSAALRKTPYGPLRECLLKTAGHLRLNNPPLPDLSSLQRKFKQTDPSTFKFQDICRLSLKTRGNMLKGETVEIIGTLTNTSKIPLAIGPAGSVLPSCVIEIQTVPAGNTKLFIDVPLDSRQILEPEKSIAFNVLLDQAISLDRKMDFGRLLSNLPGSVNQLSLQGKIFTQIILAQTTEEKAAQTPALMIEVPQMNEAFISLVKSKLSEPITHDAWSAARLCRWALEAKNLRTQQATISNGMMGQLPKPSSPATAAAMAWALRSAGGGAELFNSLAGLLSSDDWFTRFMALDTLGQLQGKNAEKLFQAFAVKDPDELVRQLSTGYLLYRYPETPKAK